MAHRPWAAAVLLAAVVALTCCLLQCEAAVRPSPDEIRRQRERVQNEFRRMCDILIKGYIPSGYMFDYKVKRLQQVLGDIRVVACSEHGDSKLQVRLKSGNSSCPTDIDFGSMKGCRAGVCSFMLKPKFYACGLLTGNYTSTGMTLEDWETKGLIIGLSVCASLAAVIFLCVLCCRYQCSCQKLYDGCCCCCIGCNYPCSCKPGASCRKRYCYRHKEQDGKGNNANKTKPLMKPPAL